MTDENHPIEQPPLHEEEAIQGTDDPFLSIKRGATEIYLIRHGDALPAAEEVRDGGYDEQALSDLGRRQALALAEYLRAVPLSAIYSSPISRARQTAAPVAATQGLTVAIENGLREVELGPVPAERTTPESAEARAAMLRERLREIVRVAARTGKWESIPGSEPSGALRQRITQTVDGLAARHPGSRIALVSHAGAINAYVAAILGIEADYFFPAANTSITVLRVRAPRHVLFALNDVSHLRAAGLLPLVD